MKGYYITDPGMVRSHNEDSVAVVKNGTGERLLVVADGMGGHKAGEVASSIAVTHLSKRFKSLDSIGSKLDAATWLDENISYINDEILKYSKDNPETNGMGTTITLAILTKTFLMFGNIGDSSGFVYKAGKLKKVTNDHTLYNALLDAGILDGIEAENFPKKNVLMRALGAQEKIEIDKFSVESKVDGIFLCSDGLTNMLSIEQIESVLDDKELSTEKKLIKLVKKCNSRGGTDNITIAILMKEDD